MLRRSLLGHARLVLPRALATAPQKLVLYESNAGYKFKFVCGIGGVYTACWVSYCAADVLFIPESAIASNSFLVAMIGATSMSVGVYLLRTFAGKTVGRLELLGERLRITTYTPFGTEVLRDVPVTDVIPLTPPNDPSRLKTFALPDDIDRVFLVLADKGDVKDEPAFQRVIHGIRPQTKRTRRKKGR